MPAPNQWLDDFQKNMSDLLSRTPAADIERNVKALMAQTFSRMDLTTREEFDVQADLLARALERIATLEDRVLVLEQHASSTRGEPSSRQPGAGARRSRPESARQGADADPEGEAEGG